MIPGCDTNAGPVSSTADVRTAHEAPSRCARGCGVVWLRLGCGCQSHPAGSMRMMDGVALACMPAFAARYVLISTCADVAHEYVRRAARELRAGVVIASWPGPESAEGEADVTGARRGPRTAAAPGRPGSSATYVALFIHAVLLFKGGSTTPLVALLPPLAVRECPCVPVGQAGERPEPGKDRRDATALPASPGRTSVDHHRWPVSWSACSPAGIYRAMQCIRTTRPRTDAHCSRVRA